MPKKPKRKVPDPKLQYLGNRIKAARNANHLTQQALADQAGIGLRHYQNIENGLINPSYKVLSSIIHRLAMSTDILFYSDISQLEEQKNRLLIKFAACTEDERAFLLKTFDCMVEQFISRHKEELSAEKLE